jgi:membrane associated rhomboid family serine protease
MASRVCPYCQGLNGASESHCYRCKRRLPGPLTTGALGFVRDILGAEAPMTRLVIVMELVVFALCMAVDRKLPLWFGDGFRGSTSIRFGALFGPVLTPDLAARVELDPEPWRFLSACFVHGSLLHVGMNMLMFASLGAQLEREFGWARATLLFLLCGILGFVATFLWRDMLAFSVGASGGVFGQVGAFIGVLYARRDPTWKKALVRMLIYAVLLGLAFPVDNAAHLGGFFAGILLGFGLHVELRRLRLHRTMAALAVLMVMASVTSVVLSSLSPVWKDERVRALIGE